MKHLPETADNILKQDSVAQLVEQYTFNVWVLGSNPSGITGAKPKRLYVRGLQAFFYFTYFCLILHRTAISGLTHLAQY